MQTKCEEEHFDQEIAESQRLETLRGQNFLANHPDIKQQFI